MASHLITRALCALKTIGVWPLILSLSRSGMRPSCLRIVSALAYDHKGLGILVWATLNSLTKHITIKFIKKQFHNIPVHKMWFLICMLQKVDREIRCGAEITVNSWLKFSALLISDHPGPDRSEIQFVSRVRAGVVVIERRNSFWYARRQPADYRALAAPIKQTQAGGCASLCVTHPRAHDANKANHVTGQ